MFFIESTNVHYVVYNASPSNAAPIPKAPAKAAFAMFPVADEEVVVVATAELVEEVVAALLVVPVVLKTNY